VRRCPQLVSRPPTKLRAAVERLAQLLTPYDEYELSEHDQRPLSIGVIAPYRAQINYLKDVIEDSEVLNGLLPQRRLSVGTVDSFQGQERDIIAITLTRSNPQGEIGFLSDIRRMNVGMTRARRKLLLVGDSSTLCRHPFFVDLLAYVKGVGSYRMAQVIGRQV
jgi:superfamily I DNA and/or RNA helicase